MSPAIHHDGRMDEVSRRRRVDRVVTTVRDGGGIVRRRRLRDGGHADRAIAEAVDRGRLVRVGRLWLAQPDTAKDLTDAASAGVVLTCVTAAERMGLWTFTDPHAHVAVRAHEHRPVMGRGTVMHWARPLVPRHPDALVDPIENVLVTVASCQPLESALTVWESAIRTGRVDPMVLARMPLPAAARRVLESASPYSDSGLETLIVPRLRWIGLRIRQQIWIAGHRVDFLIGDRLVLQIDGGHHVGAQRAEDIRHDAELALRGYHVIRVGYTQVVDDWPGVQDLIMRAVAQGLHRAA